MSGARERFSCLPFFCNKKTLQVVDTMPVGRLAKAEVVMQVGGVRFDGLGGFVEVIVGWGGREVY